MAGTVTTLPMVTCRGGFWEAVPGPADPPGEVGARFAVDEPLAHLLKARRVVYAIPQIGQSGHIACAELPHGLTPQKPLYPRERRSAQPRRLVPKQHSRVSCRHMVRARVRQPHHQRHYAAIFETVREQPPMSSVR